MLPSLLDQTLDRTLSYPSVFPLHSTGHTLSFLCSLLHSIKHSIEHSSILSSSLSTRPNTLFPFYAPFSTRSNTLLSFRLPSPLDRTYSSLSMLPSPLDRTLDRAVSYLSAFPLHPHPNKETTQSRFRRSPLLLLSLPAVSTGPTTVPTDPASTSASAEPWLHWACGKAGGRWELSAFKPDR